MSDLDLRELAYDRGASSQAGLKTRRHLLTRYVLPLALLLGFLALVVWASWDLVFPPRRVSVLPVLSASSEVQQAGTLLFQAAGWIEPRPTPVRVAALAPGVVARLLVVEDDLVKKGQAVAELVKDDAILTHERTLADLELRQAELDEARAALVAATTRYDQPVHLEAAVGEADASLAKIQTQQTNLPFQIRRAEADLAALQKDYQGKQAAEGVVAGVEIDLAAGRAAAAQALVEELRNRAKSLEQERSALLQRRDALKTQLELRADETQARDAAAARVKASTARVEQVRVDVAQAKLQLDRMTVVAPVDGRVFRLIAHPGARIGSGMTQMAGHDGSTVVTMYRPEMLQVRVDVRFEDIPHVTLNQPVEINNPALTSPLTGSVLFISSEADIQKNTLQVKVEIPSPPPVFKPEMLVDVTFLAAEREAGAAEPARRIKLYLLQQLVQQDDQGSFVWVVDQSAGRARKVAIQTGAIGSQGLVEVTSGLTVSSRIITSGSGGLKDGERIVITSEDALPATSATGGNP